MGVSASKTESLREAMELANLPWPDTTDHRVAYNRAFMELREYLQRYGRKSAAALDRVNWAEPHPELDSAIRAARRDEIRTEANVGPRLVRAANALGVDVTKRRWMEELESAIVRTARSNRDDVNRVKAALELARRGDDASLMEMIAPDRLEKNIARGRNLSELRDPYAQASLRAIRAGSRDAHHVECVQRAASREFNN